MEKIQNQRTEEELKKVKNEVNNLRTKLQKEYAEKLIQEAQGDSRRIWSVINDLCNRKVYRSNINRIINENSKKLEDREIANELNDHLANVGQRLASLITDSEKSFSRSRGNGNYIP